MKINKLLAVAAAATCLTGLICGCQSDQTSGGQNLEKDSTKYYQQVEMPEDGESDVFEFKADHNDHSHKKHHKRHHHKEHEESLPRLKKPAPKIPLNAQDGD
jgi:hypothetical protein